MQIPETEIIVSKDGAELLRKTVRPGDYVIGRDEGCELQVEVELVSRRHAQLTVNFDHVLIEDLGSSNGTFVDGEPIKEPTRLWPKQKIQVGAATIELRRIKTVPPPDATVAPSTAVLQQLLPEEFLRDKKYEIGKVVAQGGMGAILDAREATIERRVAMKVMLDGSSPDDLTRFVAEAKITGQLEHPSIVPVYELSVDENGQVFYTMKMVRGITLRKVLELLADGVPETVKKYPLPVLLTIFQKVGDAIAFAHSKGVIHRDLKPENIMLDDFGVVLVMDWGLAKVVGSNRLSVISNQSGSQPPTEHCLLNTDHSGSPTLAGTVMGTPQYMSPEQARGEVEDLDVRSDVYALGAILFQILALRSPVGGNDAWAIVDKVSKGEVEPLTAPKNRPIPDSIAAVVRQAMAFDRNERYPQVADLQRDIEAYQNGRATRAENAGVGKQLVLLIKRHKALFSTVAAAWLVITALAVWFVVNITTAKNLAEVERSRATKALDDLRRQAPALRQLAESEAGFQRFDSALEKLDAALALDPADLPSYWQRAWLFIGMDRLGDAAAAIRLAQQKDPAHAELAQILPSIEKLAALPVAERWTTDAGRNVWNHLVKVGASGETIALATRLNPGIKDKINLVRQRLDEWLGKGKGGVYGETGGLLHVEIGGPVDTLDPLHGLPIDILVINQTLVSSLEPLRGMHLVQLQIGKTKVTDLSPLVGMPLAELHLSENKNVDLSSLLGLPLERLIYGGGRQADFSPLRGAPLKFVDIARNAVSDLSFLSNAPLEKLDAHANKIVDLSPLRGKPLKSLLLSENNISDLSPLQGAPIEDLSIHRNPLKDLTPLLKLLKLERLRVSKLGKLLEPLRGHPSLKYIAYDEESYRPVAEFWAEYDAQHPAPPK